MVEMLTLQIQASMELTSPAGTLGAPNAAYVKGPCPTVSILDVNEGTPVSNSSGLLASLPDVA